MKKNSYVFAILFIALSFILFNIKASALTKEELCQDANTGCFCLKTDETKCSLQIGALSGHNYKMMDKKVCGCKENSPQKYQQYTGSEAEKNNGKKAGASGGGGGAGTAGTASASNTGMKLCEDSSVVKSVQIVGWCLMILKIVVPIVLIIMAFVELGKAVVSNDDKAIKTAVSALIKKTIAAVIIFFIPTIVSFVIKMVEESKDTLTEYDCLSTCINKPNECTIPNGGVFGSDSK